MTASKIAMLALPACGLALGALAPEGVRIPAMVMGGTLAGSAVVLVRAYLEMAGLADRSIARSQRLAQQIHCGAMVMPRVSRR